MASKRPWTVRVVQIVGDKEPEGRHLPGLWQEQMRRLGYLTVLKEWDGNDGHTEVFELHCPNGNNDRAIDSKSWADANAERMKSFGINAAACPMWMSGDKV